MENQDRPQPANPEEADSPSAQEALAQPDANGTEPEDGSDGADDDSPELNGPDASAANAPPAGMTQSGAQLGTPLGRRGARHFEQSLFAPKAARCCRYWPPTTCRAR